MAYEEIAIRQVDCLPDPSWELPDELYVRLGCADCEHGAAIVVKGVTSAIPEFSINPLALKALHSATAGVKYKTQLHQADITVWKGSCDTAQCSQLPALNATADLLKKVFDVCIDLPQ